MQPPEDTFHLGIKGLIINAAGRVLLLQIDKQKLDQAKEAYWDLPGGRIQRGEQPQDALRREIQEETGIADLADIQPFLMALSNIRIPQKDGSDVGLVLWIFTCKASDARQTLISEEHVQAAWLPIAEAAEKLRIKYPAEFIEKLIQVGEVQPHA